MFTDFRVLLLPSYQIRSWRKPASADISALNEQEENRNENQDLDRGWNHSTGDELVGIKVSICRPVSDRSNLNHRPSSRLTARRHSMEQDEGGILSKCSCCRAPARAYRCANPEARPTACPAKLTAGAIHQPLACCFFNR